MAQREISIARLLYFLNNGELAKAKQFVEDAEQEIKYLENMRKQISTTGRTALDLLQEILSHLSCSKVKEAQKISNSKVLLDGYYGHLEEYLKRHYSEVQIETLKETGVGDNYEDQGPDPKNMHSCSGPGDITKQKTLHDPNQTFTTPGQRKSPTEAKYTATSSATEIQNRPSGREQGMAQKHLSGTQTKPQITESKVERDTKKHQVPRDFGQKQNRPRKGDLKQTLSDKDHAKDEQEKARQNISQSSEHTDMQREQTAIIREAMKPKPNNPDIADLSDANRPTKIAEKFSELYDNEWTEAFDDLLNKRSQKIPEQEIIAALLHIVENSYSFCTDEAKLQLEKMNAATLSIIRYGTSKRSEMEQEETPLNLSLLKEFRKTIAHEAVPSLQQRFFKDNLSVICKEKLRGIPRSSKEDSLAKYANRAIELSWWMCVQIPPVYMFPTEYAKFDPSLYRAYTKTGKNVAFFVWPALKLYEKGGGILAKGVVQFQ